MYSKNANFGNDDLMMEMDDLEMVSQVEVF